MNKFPLTSTMLAVNASPTHGSQFSRTRTLEGYARAYELRFAACYDVLAEATTDDPEDPVPHKDYKTTHREAIAS